MVLCREAKAQEETGKDGRKNFHPLHPPEFDFSNYATEISWHESLKVISDCNSVLAQNHMPAALRRQPQMP